MQGVDAAWLAVDAVGHVALFTTGGEGPIPETALAGVESAEELVLSLPERSDVELLVALPRPDDFLAFSRRGFFSYDWSDVHRTMRQALIGYELQSRPSTPLRLSDLPDPLRSLAAATEIAGLAFGASMVVPGSAIGA